jgi:predicted porin
MPVGPGEIRASYSQAKTEQPGLADAKLRRFALGYVHNLSKRTAVYTTWAHLRGTNALAANGGATGVGGRSNVIDFGIRHSF